MAVNCKRLGVIVRIADPRGFIRFRGFDVFGMVTFLDCQRSMAGIISSLRAMNRTTTNGCLTSTGLTNFLCFPNCTP